jgi:hypothetical protein
MTAVTDANAHGQHTGTTSGLAVLELPVGRLAPIPTFTGSA